MTVSEKLQAVVATAGSGSLPRTGLKVFLVYFVVAPFLTLYGIIVFASIIRTHQDVGQVAVSELPPSRLTPYPSGKYVRLTVLNDMTVLDAAKNSVGMLPEGEFGDPATPAGLVARRGDESVAGVFGDGKNSIETLMGGNKILDTWVSETKGYTAARRLLSEMYNLPVPDANPGNIYLYAEKDSGKFLEGDVVLERVVSNDSDAYVFTILRDGRTVAEVSADPPTYATALPEYPGLPRPRTEKTLYGPSTGLLYAVQYLDSMTEGDLLAGHTVAFTGEVGQATGTVWAVGGIAEKLSAAQASGVEIVFIPQENATAGFSSLSQFNGMRIFPVENVADAVDTMCRIYSSNDAVCREGKLMSP